MLPDQDLNQNKVHQVGYIRGQGSSDYSSFENDYEVVAEDQVKADGHCLNIDWERILALGYHKLSYCIELGHAPDPWDKHSEKLPREVRYFRVLTYRY